MVLALDIGNTNVVIGCIDGGEISYVFRFSTNISKTADEYAVEINGILNFNNITAAEITGAIIASVVPPLTNVFKDAIKQLSGTDAIIVGPGVKTGLNILIDDPSTLGSDIAASSVGALATYSPPLIILDFGTATKMFVLNKKGEFIGGAILPGIALSANALSMGTSQLPRIPIEAPKKCICSNTIDCMKSGAVYGAAAAVDGMSERFEAELGQQAQIIATGGLASIIYNHCKHDIIHDPNLILRGLYLIYEKNKRR